jgi:exopolyphosphatase/guanosine-5'-triphosphate,3'-diphosphate pyrophosphatase
VRVAAIDLGTNTALCLVADVDEGRLQVVRDLAHAPRLGQGVDASARLAPQAIARVLEVLASYARLARELGAERALVTATSAARDAENRAELLGRSPLPIRVLSGAEEAALSLAGGLSGFPELEAAAVLDIGGGSTELAIGTRTAVAFARSLQLGTVRITERVLPSRPAPAEELARAEAMIDRELAGMTPPRAPEPLLAVAGTPLAVACLEHGLKLEEVEGATVTRDAVRHQVRRLAGLDPAQALRLAPDALAGRADVILAGALLMERFMTRFDVRSCRVSGRGVRHGAALRLAAGDLGA